jgi:hypothetical protein
MREISSDKKTGNLAGLSFYGYSKSSKPSRKDTQKSSMAGGVANVCKNHQIHVRAILVPKF